MREETSGCDVGVRANPALKTTVLRWRGGFRAQKIKTSPPVKTDAARRHPTFF